jgi:hypothetical protein
MSFLQLPDIATRSVSDLIDILWRRKRNVLLPVLLFPVLAGALALLLPRTYTSSATILVELRDIPQDLAGERVDGFAGQRLQAIHRRVLSDAKLGAIVNRSGLPIERKDIRLDLLDANRIEARSGRPPQVNVTFRISYDGKAPGAVREIVAELASRYPEENLRSRDTALAGEEAIQPPAERFSIVEPARFPKRPSSPNIPAILLLGLLSGVGVGAWSAFRKERADNMVRGYEQLTFGPPFPTATIGPGDTGLRESFRYNLRRGFLVVTLIVTVTLGLLLVHFVIGFDILRG